MKKNKTTYRIDCTYNNERLCIDVRDNLSLLQALSSDKQLQLDPYTMAYMISLNRSILLTSENIGDDTIKIPSRSLYQLKDLILNEEKQVQKEAEKKEKALKKKSKKRNGEEPEETPKRAPNLNIGLVEELLNEEDIDDEETEESSEEDEE